MMSKLLISIILLSATLGFGDEYYDAFKQELSSMNYTVVDRGSDSFNEWFHDTTPYTGDLYTDLSYPARFGNTLLATSNTENTQVMFTALGPQDGRQAIYALYRVLQSRVDQYVNYCAKQTGLSFNFPDGHKSGVYPPDYWDFAARMESRRQYSLPIQGSCWDKEGHEGSWYCESTEGKSGMTYLTLWISFEDTDA